MTPSEAELVRKLEQEWRPIRGYEGYYEVSDGGEVRSLDRFVKSARSKTNKMLMRGRLKGKTVLVGVYWRVNLCRDGKPKGKSVHRLVAEAFMGPCPDGMEVSHLDGNGFNNKKENLIYETRSQNHARKVQHGTAQRGERCGRHKITEKDVLEIRSTPDMLLTDWSKRLGISFSNVSAIRRRKTWRHLP